jgi:hypothetical protein
VYSREEIKELVKKPTIVILFRHHFHMKECLHLQYLIRKKVLLRAPQSISEISDRSYVKVRNEGGIDERFAIH